MTQSVQDVLSAITVASEALTREPQLRSRISDLELTLDTALKHGQELELKIIDYKNQIDNYTDKLRSVEVERDQAQFRTLELEDINSRVALRLRDWVTEMGGTVDLVDPPKPETEQPVTQHPFEGTGGGLSQPIYQEPQVGQSESPLSQPTAPTMERSSVDTAKATDTATGTTETVGQASPPNPSQGPYSGKKWTEAAGLMSNRWSKDEWLANGGSEDNWNA